MSRVKVLLVALVLAAPLVGRAADAPHNNWNDAVALDCLGCHKFHKAADGGLTNVAGNANLCNSCHQNIANNTLGFPWPDAAQAVPGTSGHSHSWSALATSRGATPPAPGTPMGTRIPGGALMCSTCHDQHNNSGRTAGTTQHVSYPVGAAQNPAAPAGATGRTMTVASVAAAANPKGYIVQFVTAGALTAARFKLSNDAGKTWFGCSTGVATTYNWGAVNAPPDATNGCQPAGTNISLNDGTNVQVTFAATATFAVGDQWKFYVGYPFMRVANQDSAMCVQCHQDRDMRWEDVEGGAANGVAGGVKTVTLGQTFFSHPVGDALNANGKGYDQAAPLDANGGTGNSDGNATNDLKLGTGGIVTCQTCHALHNVDSNATTVDK